MSRTQSSSTLSETGIGIMGKVVVSVMVESLEDLYRVQRGDLPPDQVRRVEVSDALIDSGATSLSMPRRLVAQLGLLPLRARRAMTSAGLAEVQTYSAVRLTVQGRDCSCDVTELPDECPVLIGQVPLELLDFVVDAGRRQLIGNPAHGGEHIIELF